MRIVNTSAGTVPFGKYRGYDLQELVETDHHYANWLVAVPRFGIEHPDEYEDLRYYLRAAGLYREVGLSPLWRH